MATGKIDAQSVYRAFEQVQDGRHKRGVRCRIKDLLILILLGKLAGIADVVWLSPDFYIALI